MQQGIHADTESLFDPHGHWLISDALRSCVASEQQFRAAVEEGKQALWDGKTLDHKTVVAAFERIVSPRLPCLVVYSVESAAPQTVVILRVLHGIKLWPHAKP